jgi:D-tagatose-1,6-bisphosphate aldolase subunit GatZ/KbaZ
MRVYSYSDRIRYYWADPAVARALAKLLTNLAGIAIPETLVSQSFMGLEFGDIPTDAERLLERHVNRCVSRYYEAAGFNKTNK